MTFYAHSYLDSLSAGEREQLFASHSPLGFHPDTGDELLLEDKDRFAGMYILGVQGVGKSGLLQNLIHADVTKGNAVVVLDPHGDLVNDCIAQLPPDKVAQAYVLDMEDEGYPFGANVFATGSLATEMQRAQAVDRIMHVFEVLWEDVLSQQHLPRYVRAATITFLSNPGSTLVDMLEFLLDPNVRQRMLQHVTDPTVKLFWQAQYDAVSPTEQMRRVQPLINRLEGLFMGRSLVSNIVGQKRTTINFRRAIEERQLVFIKLPIKTVAQDARLVGTILLSQLYAAVFSFGDMPATERPGVSVYVDEAQHFVTQDFASLFTEGRKFGVKLTLAHQYRDQLPGFLQQSTMTARSKVCFRTIAPDANEMAHEFPAAVGDFEPSVRAAKELVAHASDLPDSVRMFVETYLRHLPKGNGEIEFEIQPSMVGAVFFNQTKPFKVKRQNPTSYLDTLFYEVMKSQNPNLPIPEHAVYGLAGGGDDGGFHGAINRWTSANILLMDIPDFPKHLFGYDRQGNPVWNRRPEGAKEQLYHCLFHLRLTMHYLAQHPIGKQSTSSANIAAMLTQLPARCAFVKSDKAVGTIFTHNTPYPLSGDDLQRRLAAIRQQTRATYCHPRQEVEGSPVMPVSPVPQEATTVSLRTAVEGEFHLRSHARTTQAQATQDTQETPRSRWEEVDT